MFQVVVSAKAKIVVGFVGRSINPMSLVAREGPFFVVSGNDVLSEFWSQASRTVAAVSDHRKVAQNRILFLNDVMNRQANDGQ